MFSFGSLSRGLGDRKHSFGLPTFDLDIGLTWPGCGSAYQLDAKHVPKISLESIKSLERTQHMGLNTSNLDHNLDSSWWSFRGSVAHLDARQTGDQEFAGSPPAGSQTFFREN